MRKLDFNVSFTHKKCILKFYCFEFNYSVYFKNVFFPYINTHIPTYPHTHIHTYTHTCIPAYICIYIEFP